MEEIAWVKGKLQSKKLRDGLASNDPLLRQQAEDMKTSLMTRLNQLSYLMGQEGEQGSNALGNNLDAGPATAAAREIMRRLERIFSQRFTVGVTAGFGGKKAAGEHVGGGGMAHGGIVRAGTPYYVGENFRRELFVPEENGRIIPEGRLGGLGGGVNVNLSLSSLVPYTPQQMQAAARAFVPELMRELRRQRLVPN